ncbi:hypothetical protein GGR51DRAFT_562794 [Nemania sp. FL0031]|nr:hypothetical protein GGR51DRAFT_562794 [Nemania sp. FL0031]
MAHITVESYNLVRTGNELRADYLTFIEPFIGRIDKTKWTAGGIQDAERDKLVWYATSKGLGVHIIFQVNFTAGERPGSTRFTQMQHREMVLDNCRHHLGSLRSLRFLAWRGIVHTPTRNQIKLIFIAHNRNFEQAGHIELSSEQQVTDVIAGNPFTKGTERMLREHAEEMGTAKILRIILISEGLRDGRKADGDNPLLHLVIELPSR